MSCSVRYERQRRTTWPQAFERLTLVEKGGSTSEGSSSDDSGSQDSSPRSWLQQMNAARRVGDRPKSLPRAPGVAAGKLALQTMITPKRNLGPELSARKGRGRPTWPPLPREYKGNGPDYNTLADEVRQFARDVVAGRV